MVPRFDSASITSLDQSHDDTNEEEHLSLLHAVERKMQSCHLVAFSRSDGVHCCICGFVPCELEALVSQKTQCEFQTREEEEVAEINQAQHLKLLHFCKDIPAHCQLAKVHSCFINGSEG